MSQSKDKELFQIAPDVIVGTQILQANLPSNIDFDQGRAQIELTDFNSKQNKFDINKIDFDNEQIKSYSIKGKTFFSVQPLFKKGTFITSPIFTYNVKCFNDELTPGLKGIWESLVGYVHREIYIDHGYIYLLLHQKQGYLVLNHWKLTNLFKIFIDRQQSKIRLVFTEEGSQSLISKDYQTNQITEFMNRISKQISFIGLELAG